MYDKIAIIGYYDHNNIGDDQYKITFIKILKPFANEIEFIDCDTLKDRTFSETDLIVLGGGDILNEYFIDQIIDKFEKKNNKIIAISVGLPYLSILMDTNKLNIIDFIFIRTRQDLSLFEEFFDPTRIAYLPDISMFLTELYPYTQEMHSSKFKLVINAVSTTSKKMIGVSLNQHICATSEYPRILSVYTRFIEYLVQENYFVVFFPFCTESNHNDILFHTDIYNQLKNLDSVLNIDFRLTTQEILHLYNLMYISIPMRFHACLFSIYTNTPMLPIYTTRKIHNLLLDIEWENSVKLPTDDFDLPTDLSFTLLQTTFQEILNDYTILKNDLSTKFVTCDLSQIETVIKTQYNKFDTVSRQDRLIQQTVDCINKYLKATPESDFRNTRDQKQQRVIVNIVSYFLTKTPNSKYNYGLSQKMFNQSYDYIAEWKWILRASYLRSDRLESNPDGIFNINFIDQIDYSGVHRAGWQYVYENLKCFHNESSDLYLDLYLLHIHLY